jgi:hypothetical protein
MALVVNGETIDDAVIREEVSLTRPRYNEMIDGLDPVAKEIQLWDWSKETVIERTLLRQEALKDPEPVSSEAIEEAVRSLPPESGVSRGEVETRIRLDRFLQKLTSKVQPPKNKETGEYYKKYKEQFRHPEMARAAHIVKNVNENTDEKTALAAIEEAEAVLRTGVSFEEVADRFSDCAGNGGDLGYFPRGEMVEEFDQVVFGLQPNQTSGIFRTRFGFHIARCYDKRPEGFRSFNEVRPDIERMLHMEKKERALEQFVDALKAKADIRSVPKKI